MPTPPATAGLVSIADAAARLGVKPWDVVRLIEDHQIETVEFVDLRSLDRLIAKGAA